MRRSGALAGRLAAAAIAALALLSLLQPATAADAGKRVLALVGRDEIKETHSKFFKGLRDAGMEVDIRGVKDGVPLRNYDEALYSHLVLFAPKASSFGSLTSAAIVDFVDSGGNVLIALAPGASEVMRSLAADCGVAPDGRGAVVYDHFSHQAAGGAADAALVATSAWVDSDAILGAKRPKAPVLFRGIAQSVPASSELVTVALSAEPTAYSADPKKGDASTPAGGAVALVSLVQARNNARVMVAGSLDMFSDELFDAAVEVADTGKSYAKSGNRAFTLATALWTFQQRGVLRVSAPRHRNVGSGEEMPGLYRVLDEVEFEVDIFEEVAGERKPFGAEDVQVSFTMLDPHVRQPLVPGDGTFKLRFKVPDVYGVFKYTIDYSHAGYSYINLQHVVPVRPYKHDEYERFLLPAYPYYASAVSTMAAFFLAGVVYLYSK